MNEFNKCSSEYKEGCYFTLRKLDVVEKKEAAIASV